MVNLVCRCIGDSRNVDHLKVDRLSTSGLLLHEEVIKLSVCDVDVSVAEAFSFVCFVEKRPVVGSFWRGIDEGASLF
tara:strand:+ start:162 stop:392 length:231 start_codon:yes stop_codon:yes gene_type:complete